MLVGVVGLENLQMRKRVERKETGVNKAGRDR